MPEHISKQLLIKRIISLCWIVALVISIYMQYFSSFDPMVSSDNQLFCDWFIRLIGDLSLTIALVGTIILSTRSIRISGFGIKRLLPLAFSIMLFLVLSGAALYGHIAMSKIREHLNYPTARLKKNIEKNLERDELPLTTRSKISLIYARLIWEETGETIEYVTSNGIYRVFEPSVDDIETKEKMKKIDELLDWTLTGLKRAYIIYPIIALSSIAIGLFTPINQKE